jgi:hypothetical protein
MVAAFQVLINCLEENDAVLPGQFPDALGVYMEMVKSKKGDVNDMTLAVLHDIRTPHRISRSRAQEIDGSPWLTGSQRKLAGGRDFTIRP